MIKFCLGFVFLTVFFTCYGQKDTLIVKNQKGYLVLSYYNGNYDYDGGHWRPIGFHDFFFPCNSSDKNFLSDSNIAIIFKNGFRVNSLSERHYLKKVATKLQCSDTSKCYPYKEFYIIPISVTYKAYEDYEPFICQKDNFELKIKDGSHVKFSYRNMAIDIQKYSFK